MTTYIEDSLRNQSTGTCGFLSVSFCQAFPTQNVQTVLCNCQDTAVSWETQGASGFDLEKWPTLLINKHIYCIYQVPGATLKAL